MCLMYEIKDMKFTHIYYKIIVYRINVTYVISEACNYDMMFYLCMYIFRTLCSIK